MLESIQFTLLFLYDFALSIVERFFDLIASDVLLVDVVVNNEVVREVDSVVFDNFDSLCSRITDLKLN